MEYIYLFVALICSGLLSIMSSSFSRENKELKNVTPFYNLVVTVFAFVTLGVLSLKDFVFDIRVLMYSVIYGIFYSMAMTGLFKAMQTGSVSMTAFIKQLSLIMVAIWGFVFWDNAFTINIVIGFVFILIALYLCFKPDKKTNQRINLRWVLFSFMLLAGNAGCSITQKYQQIAFDGEKGRGFMFLGYGFAVTVCTLIYIFSEKCDFRKIHRKSLCFPVVAGVSSAGLNLSIIFLISSPLSESIVFPTIAVGGLIVTTTFSVTVFKEKLKPCRRAGLLVGAVALIFLNI